MNREFAVVDFDEYFRCNSWMGDKENAIEIAIAKRFLAACAFDVVEIGSVVCLRDLEDWFPVIDPFNKYTEIESETRIREDAEKVDLTGKNVMSISTVEHMGALQYGNTDGDPEKPGRFLDKLECEAKRYIVSLPCPDNVGTPNPALQAYLRLRLPDHAWFGYLKVQNNPQAWAYVKGHNNLIERFLACEYGQPYDFVTGIIFIHKGI